VLVDSCTVCQNVFSSLVGSEGRQQGNHSSWCLDEDAPEFCADSAPVGGEARRKGSSFVWSCEDGGNICS